MPCNMEPSDIRTRLLTLRDAPYAVFQAKLIPDLAPERIIGVRTPALRALAKELHRTDAAADFLRALPHAYFDENQLHAFLLCQERDFAACLAGVEAFLPHVDNWATCDQLSPPVFAKAPEPLLDAVRRWLASEQTYTVRFGIGMLLRHFLDARFDPAHLAMVAAAETEDYYVRMMCAWYFATALAKQYDAALPWLTERRLPAWTHNKAIQKAIESRRIPPERKEFLRTLRVRER